MFYRRLRSHATNKRAERTAQHRARAPSRGNRATKPSSSPSLSTISAPAATPPLPTGGRRPCSAVAYARMRPETTPSAPRNIAQGRRREGIEHSNQPAQQVLTLPPARAVSSRGLSRAATARGADRCSPPASQNTSRCLPQPRYYTWIYQRGQRAPARIGGARFRLGSFSFNRVVDHRCE